ncbi:hypothetical protein [Streptococcus danieliae]|uniref:hypothetical protein n=1 Tax=Streptococcus danieliae TaxID=747656 RepID=UPI0021C7EC55|nr:hypothetical protein [Streptococcus danieliae]MCU0082527.1 hypothetical protein [Streptococcus danieliae]
MVIISNILVSAFTSLTVSIWFGKKLIAKTVEIMDKMDAENQESNKAMQDAILSEIRRLKQIR